MRHMLMLKTTPEAEDQAPACKALPTMVSFITDLKNAGTLIATEGLQPSARGSQVRLSGGKTTITDGSFVEAKDLVAGFALVEVASKAEAIGLAERFLQVAGEGISEVREVI